MSKTELDKLTAVLRELAEVNRQMAESIRLTRESIFGDAVERDEDAECTHCEGRNTNKVAYGDPGERECYDCGNTYYTWEHDQGCRYCAEGRSHTAELCKRSGGEG